MIKVGVVGGTGYAGAELIRLLLMHPRVELAEVVSHSKSGTRLDVLHPGLQGCTDLVAQDFLFRLCLFMGLLLANMKATKQQKLSKSPEQKEAQVLKITEIFL